MWASRSASKAMRTRVPPPACREKRISPRCSSTIFLTMARPRPVPRTPGRHIGLGQPLAVLGQPDAGVGKFDHQLIGLAVSQRSMRSPSGCCSPRLRRASIASTAFLTMLVSAWPSWRGRRPANLARSADRARMKFRDAQLRAGTVAARAMSWTILLAETPAWAFARSWRIRRPSAEGRQPGGRSCRSAAQRSRDPTHLGAIAPLQALGR
jgi:hypothetical protein